jgi:23S rRNA pseudouridine1911/1915/1917 synthase
LKTRNIKASKQPTSFEVTEPDELKPFLIKALKGRSGNTIKSLMIHRQISINDKIVSRHDHKLRKGQIVTINWNPTIVTKIYPGVDIIFEDEHLIIINKREGLLSMSSDKVHKPSEEREKTAYNILRDHVKMQDEMNKIFIVHRLDKETSGLMMFAKSEEVKHLLQENWHKVVKERIYAVVTEGVLEMEKGTIRTWLKENNAKVMYSSVIPGDGIEAVTHYEVMQKGNGYSLVKVFLETGRKNQIRIHMKDIGHSVAGDEKYGAKTNPLHRLGLHAHILGFKHPVTDEEKRFVCDIPKKFYSVFEVNKKGIVKK